VEIEEDGVLEIECNVSSDVEFKDHTDFCKEWVCKNCWESWSICDYPKVAEDEPLVGIFVDHTECDEVRFKEV